MAENKKVSDLPRLESVQNDALFLVEQGGTAYSATGELILYGPAATDIAFDGDNFTVTTEDGKVLNGSFDRTGSTITGITLAGNKINISGV